MMGGGMARLLTACASSKCRRHSPRPVAQLPPVPHQHHQQHHHGRPHQRSRQIVAEPSHRQARAPLAPVPLENWRLTPPVRPQQQQPPARRRQPQPSDSQSEASVALQLSPDAGDDQEATTINLRHRKHRRLQQPGAPIQPGDACRVKLRRACREAARDESSGAVQVIDSWPRVQLRLQRYSSAHCRQFRDNFQVKQPRLQKLRAFCCLPASRWTIDWTQRSADKIAALASRFECLLNTETAASSTTCTSGDDQAAGFLEIWGPNVSRVRLFHDRLLLMAAAD